MTEAHPQLRRRAAVCNYAASSAQKRDAWVADRSPRAEQAEGEPFDDRGRAVGMA